MGLPELGFLVAFLGCLLQLAALSNLRLVERLLYAYINRPLYSALILKEEKYQETLAFRSITFSLSGLAESV